MSASTDKKKVFVGLSGGVDSAASAALLLQQGYEVTGAFIRIVLEGYPCTAGQDKLDAMRVAAHLKIPFVEVDLSKEYEERVFAASLQEFKEGRTPNPDVLCNREIKFGLFYEWARENGADLVATGHYAQIKDGLLYAGADKEKDQSYFLWTVPQETLKDVLFPVGHLHKPEVRKLAASLGLPNAARKDSQGLCFLGPVSMGDMLQKEFDPVPGSVLNEASEIAGTHDGAVLYTLGQRHGFILARQGPHTPPHYVIAKDIVRNTITVSPDKFPKGASRTKIALAETNWTGADAQDGPCMARYRYRQALIPAEISIQGDKATLNEPQYVPAGQSLVLYRQERCLGGGIIRESTVY